MITERAALEIMFSDLQREKNDLKANYRNDLAQIESRQFEILDRLQRLDDTDRKQAEGVAEDTKQNLAKMKLPQNFVIKSLKRPEKQKITDISEKEVVTAIEETKTEQEKPIMFGNATAPVSTIGDRIKDKIKAIDEKIEGQLEVAEPSKGKYTGVIENTQGEKRYQCYYECPSQRCKNKGKRFIAKQDIETFCHNCGRTLRVRPATNAGWPAQDSFNNFFVAGARKTEDEIAAAYAAPAERIDKVLEEYTKERQAEAQLTKTPSKPRRGRPAGSKNKVVGNAAAAPKKSKQDKLADKTPAAQTEKVSHGRKPDRAEELITAMELILEAKGPMSAAALEKEIKSQFGWQWANFYEPLRNALGKYPNKIFKDKSKYYYDPINKKEVLANGTGQNNVQQEKAPI